MPENQADINIGVNYDGAGAAAAISDIEKLPKSVRDLARDLNRSGFAADEMSRALRRADDALKAYVDGLDPSSAQYAKNAAQAQSFISRYQTLITRVEVARSAVQKHAETLKTLSRAYQLGQISSEKFSDEVDKIGEKSIQAERSCERLNAQLRALQANQQKQAAQNALSALPAPEPTRRQATTLRGLLSGVTRSADQGTLSLSSLTGAALRFGTVAASFEAVKVALQGVGKAAVEVGDHFNTFTGVTADSTGLFSNLSGAAADSVSHLLSNVTVNFLEAQKAAGGFGGAVAGGIGEAIASLTRYNSLKSQTEQNEAAASQAKEQREAKQLLAYQAARQQALNDTASAFQRSLADGLAAAQQTRDISQQVAKEEADAAELKAEKERQAADSQLAASQNAITLRAASGQLSSQQAEAERAAAEENHAKRLEQITAQAEAAKVRYSEALSQAATQFSEQLVNLLGSSRLAKFQPVLDVKLPDMARLNRINALLNEPNSKLTAQQTRSLETERQALITSATDLASLFASIDGSLKPSADEAVKLADTLQQLYRSAQGELDKASEAEVASQQALDAAKQRAALESKRAADASSSAEATRAEAEANSLRASITQSLADLDKRYKTSRSYAQQSNGSEASRLAADRQALTARREALRSMRRTPNLSADSLNAIDEALKETNAEIRGMQAEFSRARVSAQKSLQNWQPPDLKASNKSFSGTLRQMERGYALAAQRLERSAARGDDEGMQRAQKSMARLGAKIEQITGNTGKMLDKYQADMEAATKVRNSSNGDGLTAQQLKANEVRRGFGLPDRYKPRKTSPRKDDENDSPAARREPQQPRAAQPAAQPAAKAPDLSQANDAARQMTQQMQQLQAQAQQLTSGMQGAAAAASKAASSFAATQSQIAELKSTLERIKSKV